VDINNDGKPDLLVGEKYESVHYYQRQEDGSLKEQPLLIKLEKPDGNQNLAYMSISPSIADWNGDGAYDVILGSDVYKSGRPFPLRFYSNKGTSSNPVFDDYDTLKNKNGAVIQASCARVAVGDLNMDGKNDLVVGDRKVNVSYYKNTGTNANPVFESLTLVPSAQFGIPDKPDFQQNSGFGYATPRIYDWNKDGKPDLLLSGYPAGKILIYTNDAATPIKAISNEASSLHKSLEVSQSLSGMRISYTAITPSHVSIKLLDIRGREIQQVDYTFAETGTRNIDMQCANLPNGMYIVQFSTDKTRIIRKVLLTK
jgi:hypothetical protein